MSQNTLITTKPDQDEPNFDSPNYPPPKFDPKLITKLPIPPTKPNAQIININEKNQRQLTFTLKGVLPSFANAIRRTILSDIPVVAFITTPHEENRATIVKNTSRFNNEYLKQRLSCIPIHTNNLEDESGEKISKQMLIDNYKIKLQVANKTDSMYWVTTKDIHLVDKTTGEPMDKSRKMAEHLFPPFVSVEDTKHYIDIMCLRPFISDSLPGEEIDLTCEFAISTSQQNSCFNVAKLVSYGNTIDLNKHTKKIAELKEKTRNSKKTKEETDFIIKNFELLEGKRLYLPNSYDFVVETLGVYKNRVLVQHACTILADMLTNLLDAILMQADEKVVSIHKNEVNTIPNCWDIILHNEDYTLGTMLNDKLYRSFYNDTGLQKKSSSNDTVVTNMLNYCGFKKEHPHDKFSTIRIGFVQETHSHIEFIQFMFSRIIPQIRDEFLHISRLIGE